MVVAGAAFTADLGPRDGVRARRYKFQRVFAPKKDWGASSYKSVMLAECKKHGMKPVCDQKSGCDGGLYLGQHYKLSYGNYRRTSSNYPTGWSKVRHHWDGLCTFDSRRGSTTQYCDLASSYTTRTMKVNPNFMCGKVEMENGEQCLLYRGVPVGCDVPALCCALPPCVISPGWST